MTVKIKLQRRGRAKKPVYRVVIQDSRTARDGKTIDIIGQYNPLSEPMVLELDDEKVKQWLGNGAQPTETVERLLINKGYIQAKKQKVAPASKEAVKEPAKKTTKKAAEEA